MGAPVAFFEVSSPDHERAQQFYAELFGWKVAADPAMGGYGLVDTAAGEGAIGGGIGPVEESDSPGVRIYVRVDDLEQSLRRAEELGGTALVPPTDLPAGWGRFALFADPDGNTVGLWG
ncbi:VOC family protein [Motilibacter deserti]|uniref:VOC family protein n=1 Tax=Motilibacter deserti TaxID=2714956 RepID=A0ABX0GRV6_9ACTN|nr:VOC family protein [Motilibacter deserti]NHC12467.1 VOC family protein [Motilibacter deserti]